MKHESPSLRYRTIVWLIPIFIAPMWDNENQRLGLKKCTRLGYGLICLADFIGMSGCLMYLAMLFVAPLVIFQAWVHPTTIARILRWLLLAAVVSALAGKVIFRIAGRLAVRKQFQYDGDKNLATWIENGETREFPKAPE